MRYSNSATVKFVKTGLLTELVPSAVDPTCNTLHSVETPMTLVSLFNLAAETSVISLRSVPGLISARTRVIALASEIIVTFKRRVTI